MDDNKLEDIKNFFEQEKGITVNAAFRQYMNFNAIDLCSFARKYREKPEFIIKDIHGNPIYEGDRFTFSYMKELHSIIELTGSFCWDEDELRYEIDVHNDANYVCLSYVGNGTFKNFELCKKK